MIFAVQIPKRRAARLGACTANPNATISFTGHSLGGGLASLMAVFFGGTATTFDQAPFRNSASVAVATTLKDYLLNQQGYSEAALQGLTNFINTAAGGVIPGEGNVRDFSVQGEILSAASGSRIGVPTSLTHGAPDLTLALDLHSQALLTAFLQSSQTSPDQYSLRDVTFIINGQIVVQGYVQAGASDLATTDLLKRGNAMNDSDWKVAA